MQWRRLKLLSKISGDLHSVRLFVSDRSLRSKRFRGVWAQRNTEEGLLARRMVREPKKQRSIYRPVILCSRTAQKLLLRRLVSDGMFVTDGYYVPQRSIIPKKSPEVPDFDCSTAEQLILNCALRRSRIKALNLAKRCHAQKNDDNWLDLLKT